MPKSTVCYFFPVEQTLPWVIRAQAWDNRQEFLSASDDALADSLIPGTCYPILGQWVLPRSSAKTLTGGAAEPKELVWVSGAGHVDLYDRVDLISFDKLTSAREYQRPARLPCGRPGTQLHTGRGQGRRLPWP